MLYTSDNDSKGTEYYKSIKQGYMNYRIVRSNHTLPNLYVIFFYPISKITNGTSPERYRPG
jgi:hypothetical protein